MLSELQKRLLQLLQPGSLVSGSHLANQLNLSRTAIWKSINQLAMFGIDIERSRRGYRLLTPLAFYQPDLLQATLEKSLKIPFALTVLDSVTSTNDIALTRLTDHIWQFVLAEQQTAGRGRRGRHWISSISKHIYLSFAFKHAAALIELQGLSIALAMALRETLLMQGFDDIQLKWPNDVFCNGKKVAGILIDITGEVNSGYNVVVGVGVNVQPDPELTACDATALGEYQTIQKQDLLIELIPNLVNSIQDLQVTGLAPFCKQFDAAHLFHEQRIQIQGGSKFKTATVLGLSACGGLLVEHKGEQRCLYASEISIRT